MTHSQPSYGDTDVSDTYPTVDRRDQAESVEGPSRSPESIDVPADVTDNSESTRTPGEEDFDIGKRATGLPVEVDELEVSRFQALLQDRRKIVSGILLVLLLVVAIYVLFPKIVGADEAVLRAFAERRDVRRWDGDLVGARLGLRPRGAGRPDHEAAGEGPRGPLCERRSAR
jgi:hypothetical protein